MAIPVWLRRLLGGIAIVLGGLIFAASYHYDSHIGTHWLGLGLGIGGAMVVAVGAVLLKPT